jgi:acetyl-CoA acyltransferase
MDTSQDNSPKAVLVDGCRIPFQRSSTNYNDLMAYDLGRMAIEGLLARKRREPEILLIPLILIG